MLRASGEYFSKRLSKLHSNLPEEHCWRNFLFQKTYKFMILLGFGVKTYWQDSTLAEQPLKRNCLFAKNCGFIKFLRAPAEKFAARLSKMQSSFAEEHFWRNHLLERNYRFLNFFGLWFKYFWQDCQNCILYFQMNIYGGHICLKKLQVRWFFSGLREKYFWQDSQNCILYFQRNIYRGHFYWKDYRFYDFLRVSGEKVSTGLWTLRSFLPKENFRTNFILKKTIRS